MKSRKVLIIILTIVIVFFSFSNYSSVNTIDDSAYVIALGLDSSSNGKVKLSLQIAIPTSSSSGKSSSSPQSASSMVNTVECVSIYSGINLVNSYISKKLNLSYCKVAVFSEEFASNGISEYVSTLINDVELRPTCHLVISKCDAKYFLENSKPMLEDLSSKYYEIEASSEKNTGYTKAITLLDFYNSYYDTFTEPCAILGSINEIENKHVQSNNFSEKLNAQNSEKLDNISYIDSENSGSSEKTIENLGLAVFKNDSFVGELTSSQTLCHLIVSNRLKGTTINVPSPFSDTNYISLYVSKVKSNNDVKIINGSPFITCDISFSARVLSSTIASNYLTNENIKKIEDYCNSYLKCQINDYLYKTSIEFKSDITGFGKIAIKDFSNLKDWKEYDWLNNYSSSVFNVNVDTNIVSSYLVIGNKK